MDTMDSMVSMVTIDNMVTIATIATVDPMVTIVFMDTKILWILWIVLWLCLSKYVILKNLTTGVFVQNLGLPTRHCEENVFAIASAFDAAILGFLLVIARKMYLR